MNKYFYIEKILCKSCLVVAYAYNHDDKTYGRQQNNSLSTMAINIPSKLLEIRSRDAHLCSSITIISNLSNRKMARCTIILLASNGIVENAYRYIVSWLNTHNWKPPVAVKGNNC
jgi:hypothetical protein